MRSPQRSRPRTSTRSGYAWQMCVTGVPALPISIPATLARRDRPSSAALPGAAVDDLVERPPVGPLHRLAAAGRADSRARRSRCRTGRPDGRGSRARGPGRRRPSGSTRCRGRRPRPASASPPGRGRSRASRAAAPPRRSGRSCAIAAAARAMCAAAAPHLRQPGELLAVGDDHEVPRLPVARGGRDAARLEDPVEVGVRQRPFSNCRTFRRERMASQVSMRGTYRGLRLARCNRYCCLPVTDE